MSSVLVFFLLLLLSLSPQAANFTLAPTESYASFGSAAVYGALYTSFAFAGIFGTMGAKALASRLGPDAAFTALSASSLLAFAAIQLHARPPALD